MRRWMMALVMLAMMAPFPAVAMDDPIPEPDPGPDQEEMRDRLLGLFGLSPVDPIQMNGFCKPGAGCYPLYVDETGDTMTGALRMMADIQMADGTLFIPQPVSQASGPAPYPESLLSYGEARFHMPVNLTNRVSLLDDANLTFADGSWFRSGSAGWLSDLDVNGSMRVTGEGNTFEVTEGAVFLFDNISVNEIIANDPNKITFKVNNTTVFRLIPTATTPNIIGGFGGNNASHPDGEVVGSFIGGGGNATGAHLVHADYSVIGGGRQNVVGEEDAIAAFASVVGGEDNTAAKKWSYVGGGTKNRATGTGGVIAGGTTNTVSGTWGFVGSGWLNEASDNSASVLAGQKNHAEDWLSSVVSGSENTATGWRAVVLGGYQNTAGANASTVLNGYFNEANGFFSLAAGRQAKANHDGATVLADSTALDFTSTTEDEFSVRATGGIRWVTSVDASGAPVTAWRIEPTGAAENYIGGSAHNQAITNPCCLIVQGAVIAGGGSASRPNLAYSTNGFIGGGVGNQVGSTSTYRPVATVAGGIGNTAEHTHSTVAGGNSNLAGGHSSAVVGGVGNRALGTQSFVGAGFANEPSGSRAVVGGGRENTASGGHSAVGGGAHQLASDHFATIGGGEQNQAGNGGTATDRPHATVGGGFANAASGERSTISGGSSNEATSFAATVGGGDDNRAGGAYAVVVGGSGNLADGSGAVALGGHRNSASGDHSVTAGREAKANHQGAFVWADDNGALQFPSTAVNEFSARATGGVRFVSAIDGTTGAPTAGVVLAPGSGSWSSLSDRDLKQDIDPLDPTTVLDRLLGVPMYEWSYIAQGSDVRHVGPMAQDFHAAFGLGEDETRISSVDADGVALAAIQGLHEELEERDRRISELEERLLALERLLLDEEGEDEGGETST